jgi:uncharacterized protein (TIGR02449 family)
MAIAVACRSVTGGASGRALPLCLTGKAVSWKLPPMDTSLDMLEAKIDQVAALCQQLRGENHALRERIADLEQEKQALAARMTIARERLETVMERMPVE